MNDLYGIDVVGILFRFYTICTTFCALSFLRDRCAHQCAAQYIFVSSAVQKRRRWQPSTVDTAAYSRAVYTNTTTIKHHRCRRCLNVESLHVQRKNLFLWLMKFWKCRFYYAFPEQFFLTFLHVFFENLLNSILFS